MKLGYIGSKIKELGKLNPSAEDGSKLVEDGEYILLRSYILGKQPSSYFKAGKEILSTKAGLRGDIGIKPVGKDWYILLDRDGSPCKCRTIDNALIVQSEELTPMDTKLLGVKEVFLPCNTHGILFEDCIKFHAKSLLYKIEHYYKFDKDNELLKRAVRAILNYYINSKKLMDYKVELKKGLSIKRLKNGLTIKLDNEKPYYFMKKCSEDTYERYELSFTDLTSDDWVIVGEN